ncbi:IS3 family transposase [Candidatus Saccharibacteria bacterium]|nr:IS3 family transposase [Candidatus Saccharibacteria bacterium]MBR6122931.1 IS3 family transposase [Candidatus Saccharibacteria bacterium]
MAKRHSEKYIKNIVKEFEKGASIKDVEAIHAIPESTLYRWLSEYQERGGKEEFTLKRFNMYKKRYEDCQLMLDIVTRSPFIKGTPLPIREAYMAVLQKRYHYKSRIVCGAFGVDHVTYHHYLYDNKSEHTWFVERRKRLEKLVSKIFMDSGGSLGAKKIHAVLRNQYHEKISLKYVRDIMRDLGLRGPTPKHRKRDVNLAFKRRMEKENLIKQDFNAEQPNQKWVLDCKMFYCKNHRIEICVIEDLFARKVVAYRLGSKECGRLVCATLKDALAARKPRAGLIIHSDGGSSNRSILLNRLIASAKAKHSYSRTRDPYDNSVIESFFSRFATEFLYDAYEVHPFSSMRDMSTRVEKYIYSYNYKRPHGYNDGLTPVEAEEKYYKEITMHKAHSSVDRSIS